MSTRVREATGREATPEELAASFLEVGVEAMANAIRQVSTRQGLDADDFTLFCFGGAAGQHACSVARAAGMRRILVHPLASVLSAFGIGVADRLAVKRASLQLQLTEDALGSARARLGELEVQARAELEAFRAGGADKGVSEALAPDHGTSTQVGSSRGSLAASTALEDVSAKSESDNVESVPNDVARVRVEHSLELRAGDSETSLSVPVAALEGVLSAFGAAHLRRFGFAAKGLRIMIDAVRVEARMSSIDASSLRMPDARVESVLPTTARAWFGSWREVPLLPSSALAGVVKGPALIVEPNSTLVLEEFDGCDAVQTHMTNSRLTDPEILEARFPVLLREFSIRRGSGGKGRYVGGNGSVRRIEFRAPLSGALLANHRRIAPFGVDGGAAGVVGGGRLLRAGGGMEEIGATASFEVEVGDVLTILTPGGGGFGAAGDGVRSGGGAGGEFGAAGGDVRSGGVAGGGTAGGNIRGGGDDQRASRRRST